MAALSVSVGGDQRPGGEPLSPDHWDQLIRFASVERIEGHLSAAAHSGLLATTTEQLAQLDELHLAAVSTNLRLERVLLETLDILDAAGVAALVLKGSAVAHLDYTDPALRSFGDVDLLVRPDEIDAAIETLLQTGHTRQFPEPRPGWDRRFGKGAVLITPQGWEIDLHRSLALGPFGLALPVGELWAAPGAYELGGRAVGTLSTAHRVLHACYHAALGNVRPRLVALADIAQITQRHGISGDQLRSTAQRWEGEAVLACAVRLVHDGLGVDVADLAAWSAEFRPSKGERRALRAYAEGSSYADRAVAGLWAVRGLTAKVAYARALVMPERGYVRERYAGSTDRWRRGLRRLLASRR